jgi:hypothetical protein
LALEELLEEEIGGQTGTETVGLVFVERRITAMALHNYFLWRNDEVDKDSMLQAKTLRHKAVDMFPQVRYCQDGEESQFDDSADDPFVVFQSPQVEPPKVHTPKLQTSGLENPTTQISLGSVCQKNDQFMDADDDNLSFGDARKSPDNSSSLAPVKNGINQQVASEGKFHHSLFWDLLTVLTRTFSS